MACYKASHETFSIWSPLASSTSINKLQVMQNAALRLPQDCSHPPSHIMSNEENLPWLTRCHPCPTLTNKSPFLNHAYTKSMPNHIHHHYSPFLTLTHTLFNCTHIPHHVVTLYLWTNPAGVTALRARSVGWRTTSGKIALPSLARVKGVGRQQQHVVKPGKYNTPFFSRGFYLDCIILITEIYKVTVFASTYHIIKEEATIMYDPPTLETYGSMSGIFC